MGTLVRVTVAALLTALFLWQSHPREVWAVLAHARWTLVLLACALVVIDRTLMAWRWFCLLRPFATGTATFAHLLHIFFVSTFVGTFLPASVGGDAVRAAALARHDVRLADSVASVFMDRVLGVAGILLLAVIGLWLARDLPYRNAVLVSVAIVTVGCLVVGLATFSTMAGRLLLRVARLVPWTRAQRAAGALVSAIQQYATHRGMLANVFGASLLVQVLRVTQAWCLGVALSVPVGPAVYFAFIPLILLIMLLPVTVNGIGTSQAAFVLFFGQAGVAAPLAFALSVLFMALGIVGNLPGGALYAWRGFRAGD